MSRQSDDDVSSGAESASPGAGGGRAISRAGLLAGGAGAAAGLSLGGAGSAIAGLATGSAGAAPVGVSPPDQHALEMVFRIDQDADAFIAYGYLTHVAGLSAASLFSGGDQQSEKTALFTVHSVTTLKNRFILENIRVIDVEGSMDIYQRAYSGASFDSPESFAQGKLIASYAVNLQSTATITAPRQAVDALSGFLKQTKASPFASGGAKHVLGKPGLRLRYQASGFGRLLEPKKPRSVMIIGGNASIIA